ncbi:MAG: DUF4178 domain-containing protein [Spirochaetota bacterium]
MSYSQKVSCPSCGSPHVLENPAIVQITCNHCHTLFYWDTISTKDSGKKTRLMPAISGLTIGTTGKLKGEEFRVLGRVRYAYKHSQQFQKDGHWEEWYIEWGGDTAWLSEDMGELILEQAVRSKQKPEKKYLRPGNSIRIGGERFLVREAGLVRCQGAEGELPFQVTPDKTYFFADATSLNGKVFLSIEHTTLRKYSMYSGQRLKKGDISFQALATEHRKASEALRCSNCGSPIERLDDQIKTIVCPACHSALQVEENVTHLLGLTKPELATVFQIPLGREGSLLNKKWTVIGRVRKDWLGSETGYDLEYLVYNAKRGYMWLVESEGEFILEKPTDTVPLKSLFKDRAVGSSKKIGNQIYHVVDSGKMKTTYMDGSLPWVEKIGDISQYVDAENNVHTYTEEHRLEALKGQQYKTTEIEFFRGIKVSVEEIKKAFGAEPRQQKFKPSHPHRKSSHSSSSGISLFVLIILFLIFFSMIKRCTCGPSYYRRSPSGGGYRFGK